ncbi:MAG TPA: MAPEG family protein [Steroidobacteraceae bacterium]|jgi:glutathione S-transferase|nr:MAPEG family protein [Steroidobacteraceae bacterium]
MEVLSLKNPVFAAYVLAASIVVLKGVGMSWLTVVKMMQARGGFRSPEDLRKTLLNPDPNPAQLEPNERVERIRRIQLNDLENLPYFLAAGLLYVFSAPTLLLAQCLFYGYVVSRLAHFIAYITAQTHDVRAALWTPGSLILIYMSLMSLSAALRY